MVDSDFACIYRALISEEDSSAKKQIAPAPSTVVEKNSLQPVFGIVSVGTISGRYIHELVDDPVGTVFVRP